MQRQKPAELVIEVFGGVRAAARALGEQRGWPVHPSIVSGWVNRSGGNVPPKWHPVVMAAAKAQKGVEITYTDLAYWEES